MTIVFYSKNKEFYTFFKLFRSFCILDTELTDWTICNQENNAYFFKKKIFLPSFCVEGT